jgi:hypothetical protein
MHPKKCFTIPVGFLRRVLDHRWANTLSLFADTIFFAPKGKVQ